MRTAGPKAFVEAIVLRGADDAGGKLRDGAGRVHGRRGRPATPCRWRRPASSRGRSSARSAPVTAEIVKKSDGAYRAGDEAGLSGLEARYDERLRGTPGVDRARPCDAQGDGP